VVELEVEKRRLCGQLNPTLAISILQKTPPDAVWNHTQTQAMTTIYSPFA
jgi:hypothetical protein